MKDTLDLLHEKIMKDLESGNVDVIVDMIDEDKAGCSKEQMKSELDKFVELKPE